jgi:hypothetical protein
VIAATVAAILCRLDEAIYLGCAQEVLCALVGINRFECAIGPNTFYLSPIGWFHLAPPNQLDFSSHGI